MRRWMPLFVCAVLGSLAAHAHELRPAYLTLHELAPDTFSVLWKTPMRGDDRLALDVEFSGEVAVRSDVATTVRSSAAIQEWRMRAPNLRGQTVRVRGLEGTMTDVLVQVHFADGTVWSRLLTPRSPAAPIASPEPLQEQPPTPDSSQNPLAATLIAWAVMCVAATNARGGNASLRASVAYIAGIGGAFYLIRSIVEFIPVG